MYNQSSLFAFPGYRSLVARQCRLTFHAIVVPVPVCDVMSILFKHLTHRNSMVWHAAVSPEILGYLLEGLDHDPGGWMDLLEI